MARDIPVGNGSLLITHDNRYRLRDIYFPSLGKENHTVGHGFMFGIWVDGKLEWTHNGSWKFDLGYVHESLVTDVEGVNDLLGVKLRCHDAVDYRENIHIKKVILQNLSDRPREFRIFFHHDFHIFENPAGDTAYYDPEEKALIHYKADRYFLISGMRNNLRGFDQYATGIKEFNGFEGTCRDAEDGWLEGNPISQGSVDSTLSFLITVPGGGEQTLYHWMAAGKNNAEVSRLNRLIVRDGPNHFIQRTWSHAAYVATFLEYLRKLEELHICPHCGRSLHRHDRAGREQHKGKVWKKVHEAQEQELGHPLTYVTQGEVEYEGKRATITIDQKRCVGATMCAFTCPVAIYELVDDKSHLVRENLHRCLLQTCMNCRNNCPTNAIRIDFH